MEEKYLQTLLTQRNIPLWRKIERKDSINIRIWDNNYSELYTKNYLIEFRLKSLDINSFNHELCHLYINQVFGGIFPSLNSKMPYDFRDNITRDCLQQIANFIEHKLFFDLYVEIGGDINEFVADFHKKNGNNFHLFNSCVTINNIGEYLGNLFSILGDCNIDIDYSKELEGFRKLSEPIFEASKILISEIIDIGICKQLEDFEINEKGVIINKTQNNSCYQFWQSVESNLV